MESASESAGWPRDWKIGNFNVIIHEFLSALLESKFRVVEKLKFPPPGPAEWMWVQRIFFQSTRKWGKIHTKLNEGIQNRHYLLVEFCSRVRPQVILKYSPIVGISQVLCMGPRGSSVMVFPEIWTEFHMAKNPTFRARRASRYPRQSKGMGLMRPMRFSDTVMWCCACRRKHSPWIEKSILHSYKSEPHAASFQLHSHDDVSQFSKFKPLGPVSFGHLPHLPIRGSGMVLDDEQIENGPQWPLWYISSERGWR